MAYATIDFSVGASAVARNPQSRIGRLAIIGYHSTGSNGSITTVNGYDTLSTKLGIGPVRMLLDDYYGELSKRGRDVSVIYAAASVAGANGDITHTGTGVGSATLDGTVKVRTNYAVKVVSGGALGTATYAVSRDGGETYGDTTTTLESGVITLGNGDLTLTLTGTLVTGDLYAWLSDADTCAWGSTSTAGSIYKALVDYVAGAASLPERIHICAHLDADAIADLKTYCDTLVANKAQVLFSFDYLPRDINSDETVSEWVDAALAYVLDTDVIGGKWISPIIGTPTLRDSDGSHVSRSPTGVLLGRETRLQRISDSLGITYQNGEAFSVNATVYEQEIIEADWLRLNNAGFSGLRSYASQDGYYCTRMGTLAGASNIYRYADRMRVMSYALGVAYSEQFKVVDQDSTGAEATATPELVEQLISAVLNNKLSGLAASAKAEVIASGEDGQKTRVEIIPLTKLSSQETSMRMVEEFTF